MYDLIIIGAGVSGCCIAREISRYKIKACVIEKGDDVYRKLRRADCRNDFFKHALEYLKGREILFVISLPYFYCAGLAICATLPFLEV